MTQFQDFTSDDHHLETWFSNALGKFCMFFNAKFESFKTEKAFNKRKNELIEKFNLKAS